MVVLARGCWGQQLLRRLLLPLLRHLQLQLLARVLLRGVPGVGWWKPQLHPPQPAGREPW
jgi:hypothetical protein